jgi:hypothetical protein
MARECPFLGALHLAANNSKSMRIHVVIHSSVALHLSVQIITNMYAVVLFKDSKFIYLVGKNISVTDLSSNTTQVIVSSVVMVRHGPVFLVSFIPSFFSLAGQK